MENEKKEKITPPLSLRKIFTLEAFLFSLTMGLGLLHALQVQKILEIERIEITPTISFWNFVFSIFLATLFILFIIRFFKFKKEKRIVFKVFFVLAVFFGGLLFLQAWLEEGLSVFIISLLVFWWLKKPSVLNQNILMILGMAGAGSILGQSLEPELVIFLLIIFSIYDFIAVYKTKHMVEMAKEMMESQAILALVIPPHISGFQKSLSKIKPGGSFLVLGGGDIIFPLLFSVSLLPSGIFISVIVAIFSLIGLLVGFYFFLQPSSRQPIPALPPIAFFSIIGFLLTKLIF